MTGLHVRWRSAVLHSLGSDADVLTLAATALCALESGQKRRGCRALLLSDKTRLSDMMVSLQSSPAPGARWGRTSISGANTRTSSCGRLQLIGQEQSWSS